MRLSRSFPINCILINTKTTGGRFKLNSVGWQKLMMFFQIGIEEPTMIRSITKNIPMKMLKELLSVSIKSMVHKMKMRKSSLKLITQTEKEIIMKFLEFQNMLLWMKLKELTENLLFSTIQRTITIVKSQEEDLMRWTKPIMHFQQRQGDIIMIYSNLAKLLLLELKTSLKISGEIDSMNYNREINSSSQY